MNNTITISKSEIANPSQSYYINETTFVYFDSEFTEASLFQFVDSMMYHDVAPIKHDGDNIIFEYQTDDDNLIQCRDLVHHIVCDSVASMQIL